MQIPIEITFRDMTPSAGLETFIGDWAARLERVLPLQRCTVVIEHPHNHHRHGTPFQIHLSISIPGREIAVSHAARAEHEDPYRAVSDAFRAARRQLLDFVAQRREARPLA
jgi:ribosome-associated translation inhibitor RaiA